MKIMSKTQLHVFAYVIVLVFSYIGEKSAMADSANRSCTVREVSEASGYTYIRCQNGNNEVWLATPSVTLNTGEVISYPETPPLVNFQSKTLNRTFPYISFIPGVQRSNVRRESLETPDNVFSGTDVNGTIVFSDDPSKVPNKGQKLKAKNSRTQQK